MMSEPSSSEQATPGHQRSVHCPADYVYGTISTLVAIAGLTFETHPEALTTAAVVVGALAIWFAHTLSLLVTKQSWQRLELHGSDVRAELQGSWSIVTAAIPSVIIFVLAGAQLFTVRTAFLLSEAVGVLALAVVGLGTAGGAGRSKGRRTLYILGLVSVGVTIVLLESLVHLL
jgi:NADH:ubiquinone oxidoreductase subunit 6 (subunit J)